MTEMTIAFGGDGQRVEATFDGLTVITDQDGSAPSPFELFLASLGTCAGFYVLSFCRQRGIPTEGIRLRQTNEPDPGSRLIGRVRIEVEFPADFPAQYRDAAIRSAQLCTVKKHLEHPPVIEVRAR